MAKEVKQLPFTIGQSVEEKSFIRGFRGAWFRGKIKKINYESGKCQLEYCDYPDTKPTWTELYKTPPHLRNKSTRELMIRPCYPPICNQNEMGRDSSENSEVAVVIKNDWQLGDLVDWLLNDAWWSGRIIELMLSGKAKVAFLLPPLGEGTVEEVFLKDIRPSLDWSPESNWIVPTQDNGHTCAHLIGPVNPVPVEDGTENYVEETEMLIESSRKPSLVSPLSSSLGQKGMEIPTDAQAELLEDTVPTNQEELNRTGTSSGSRVKPLGMASNSPMQLDSAVEAVLVLEDCLSRVKLLKAVLEAGTSISEDALRPKWEYVRK